MLIGQREHASAAIVGLGNILLTDDGVGVHAVRKLMENASDRLILAEIGTAVLDAMDLFERVDFVVAIDAVRAGGPPGTIYCLDIVDVDVQGSLSLHEFGLVAAVESLPVESRPRVVILGVEPAIVDCGMRLSPTVQAVLGRVVEAARTMALQSCCKTTGV
jgi:hydrogenase maturation protease